MKKLNKPTTMLVAFAIAAAMTGCSKDDEPNNDNNSNNGTYEINGHTFVDLGLPSGLLWADRNIGASQPAAYGDYFAWGETKPKADYSEYTYKYGSDEYNYTKYNLQDGKMVLDAADDAATANWGSSCRMPTNSEFEELYSCCSWTWLTSYVGIGSHGFIVTGANGNSIFLPAAGECESEGDFSNRNSRGLYWSSSRVRGKDCDYAGIGAYNLYIRHETDPEVAGIIEDVDPSDAFADSRPCGYSVRAVTEKKK